MSLRRDQFPVCRSASMTLDGSRVVSSLWAQVLMCSLRAARLRLPEAAGSAQTGSLRRSCLCAPPERPPPCSRGATVARVGPQGEPARRGPRRSAGLTWSRPTWREAGTPPREHSALREPGRRIRRAGPAPLDCLAGGRVLLHEEVSDSPGDSANDLPALFRLPAVDVDPAQDDADNDEQCRWPDLFVRPLHPCPNGVDGRRRNHRDRLGSGLADTDVERRHDGVNPLRPSANAERGEILGVVGKQDAWRQQRSQCRGRIVVRVQFLDSRSTLVEGAQPVRKRDDPDEGKPLVGKEP